jgi:hypothetical protein
MANELTVSCSLSFTKANCQQVVQAITTQVTVAGTYTTQSVQLIGTVDETVTMSADMGTIGFVLFQNLDATNFILIGNDGSNYPTKILAGQISLVHFNGTIHAKADTGACKLGFTAIEL